MHIKFSTVHNYNMLHFSFRCVSYNILADLYCDSDFTHTVLHPYCPPYALHIDYRKQLIVKELKGWLYLILMFHNFDPDLRLKYYISVNKRKS